MGTVDLRGESPFDLGTAQRATAQCVNGGVEISLFFVLPDRGPQVVQIPLRLSAKVASKLASDLSAAAVEAALRENRSQE
jgi:hypothetical protein